MYTGCPLAVLNLFSHHCIPRILLRCGCDHIGSPILLLLAVSVCYVIRGRTQDKLYNYLSCNYLSPALS